MVIVILIHLQLVPQFLDTQMLLAQKMLSNKQ